MAQAYAPKRISKANPRLRIISAKDTSLQNAFKVATRRKVEVAIQEGVKFKDPQKQIDKAMWYRRRETIGIVRSYYDGMFRSISDILSMRGDYKGTFAAVTYPRKFPVIKKTVKLATGDRTPERLRGNMKVELESGRSAPMRWRGLPAAYVAKTVSRGGLERFGPPRGRWKGLPKSEQVWRKTGTLASQYQAWYEANRNRFIADMSYGSGRKPKLTPKPANGVLWRYTYEIEYPATGNTVLNVILRNSFATGRAREFAVDNFAGKTIGIPAEEQSSWVRTVSRIQYAEYSRPIFARFAAAAGNQQRRALKAYLVNAERRKK